MFHREKIFIVGDRVLINKQQGTVKYIGELISSNKIWIGIQLHSHKTKKMRKKLLQQKTERPPKLPKNITGNEDNKPQLTNGTVDNVVYIENANQTMNIIFVEPCKIKKWFRGVGNKHFSRKFYINQQVWIKSIKCKASIKSMFYEAPKYILQQIKNKKASKHFRQYVAVLLHKSVGNNVNNKIKYFQCPNKYDFFLKLDSKQIIPLDEYNERLSSYNLELIVDHCFREYFYNVQLAGDLLCLLISFVGAMDGTLNLKENEVYKYREHCMNFDDYYEYDSVYLGKGSRLLGGKLICIKCFGHFVMDEKAEICVNAKVKLTKDEIWKINSNSTLKFGAKGDCKGGKGGGIIKIICFGNVFLKPNALLSANGETGNLVAGFGGGGTVYIKCDTLINHGRLLAIGCNNMEPIWQGYRQSWHWSLYRDHMRMHGPDGQIIINGKYTEDGCPTIDSSYCGPILKPFRTFKGLL